MAPHRSPSVLPVTVIGGYLGAGKTTLLNRLLRAHDGRRIAVLVNDFGEINIDAALIENRDGRTIGLANGCVCCSIADDLGGALDRVAALSPAVDQVYIETSGVADPARVSAYARTWPGYCLAGVLVLANVTRVRQQAGDKYIGATVTRQLRGADAIALSHIDLLPPESGAAEEMAQWLRSLAPQARIVPLVADLPLDVLAVERVPIADSSLRVDADGVHEPGSDVQTVTFQRREPLDLARLRCFLDTLDPEVVRAKGFILGVNEPKTALLLQFAGDTWSLVPAPPSADVPIRTTIVFHIVGGEAYAQRLRTALESL
ncbi:CobW family GTP-binding protein [Candidatus Entotheonella palauensis]|uniref:CobW C-terminal domain-containing protein n=1 Tax=Candidatus Entotheonella gemina TaxID=1429439 RepID=W4LT35_9BACT|nr:GTP-binding protein [Candidatus Entotheonella palauensis]ETX01214.1 MAG: hypothetical protein ETSY2_37650 [Candidatus Entotheonella gemina]